MLNYNGDVNHSQQVRHGAVVMFLTTHSVFEQLLLYDERERSTLPGARVGGCPGRRGGAGVAGRAHKELTDTRVRCARVCCVARVLGVVRAARRAAARVRCRAVPCAAGLDLRIEL